MAYHHVSRITLFVEGIFYKKRTLCYPAPIMLKMNTQSTPKFTKRTKKPDPWLGVLC